VKFAEIDQTERSELPSTSGVPDLKSEFHAIRALAVDVEIRANRVQLDFIEAMLNRAIQERSLPDG
jgi:hypothetical protein